MVDFKTLIFGPLPAWSKAQVHEIHGRPGWLRFLTTSFSPGVTMYCHDYEVDTVLLGILSDDRSWTVTLDGLGFDRDTL